LTGKQGVFTESFALAGNATLPRVKGVTAWQFVSGITHMSTFSIQNILSAEEYGAFSDFTGRLSLLCQRGKPVSDVAVLVPEASVWASYNPPDGGLFPHYIKCNPDAIRIDHVFRETCHQFSAHQRDFEIISEGLIQAAKVDNGTIELAGFEFSFLILPEARMLQKATLDKLEEFLGAGGFVAFVGSLPYQNPKKGLDDAMTDRIKAMLASSSEQSYHTASLKGMDELITWMEEQISPAIRWEGAQDIRVMHRQEEDRDIILLANPGLNDITGLLTCGFGGEVSLWDPETGLIESLGNYEANEEVMIRIPPETAQFLVIE
jgi:hypothetical protein